LMPFSIAKALLSSLFSVSLIILRASFIVFPLCFLCASFIFSFGLEAELGSAWRLLSLEQPCLMPRWAHGSNFSTSNARSVRGVQWFHITRIQKAPSTIAGHQDSSTSMICSPSGGGIKALLADIFWLWQSALKKSEKTVRGTDDVWDHDWLQDAATAFEYVVGERRLDGKTMLLYLNTKQSPSGDTRLLAVATVSVSIWGIPVDQWTRIIMVTMKDRSSTFICSFNSYWVLRQCLKCFLLILIV
jgi:hypothetical protein